jgi:hypothetical protein
VKAGVISYGGVGVECSVRDISEMGTALVMEYPNYIPGEFALGSDRLICKCRVAWRDARRLGAEFV